jgi:DNA-binding transcriptional regulator/RsmH inhibitor MraZ
MWEGFMPKYLLKMDDRRRITLPEPVANNLGKEIYLSPNTVTMLLHKKDASLDDIIKSTKLLLEMLKHEKELKEKGLLKE